MLCLTMNLKLLLVHKILSGCFIGFSSFFFLCFTEELNESIALHCIEIFTKAKLIFCYRNIENYTDYYIIRE
jgi:hypothetical protein